TFIAGYTATNKLYGLLEIAAVSYGYAVSTYVGQNAGAAEIRRIHRGVRAALLLAVATSVIIGACMLLFGKMVVSIFLSGSEEEVAAAMGTAYRYLSIMSCMLPVLYTLHVIRSALQGMGDTVMPMASGFAEFLM